MALLQAADEVIPLSSSASLKKGDVGIWKTRVPPNGKDLHLWKPSMKGEDRE
jgi:hypothetical protein